MPRLTLGVIAGILAYFVGTVAIVIAMQSIWPDFYPDIAEIAEMGSGITTSMLIRRILVGWLAVLIAGVAAGLVSKRDGFAGLINGVAILVLASRTSLSNGQYFPTWYLIVFLSVLIPLSWAGGKLSSQWRVETP